MTLPITSSAAITPADSEYLHSISESLSKAYRTRQIYRTETEARVSVLGDIHFPTRSAKYWQCVREQCSMLEALAGDSIQYRRNEVMAKRHTKVIQTSNDPFDIEDAQISLDECEMKRASLTTSAMDRVREIRMWEMLKDELDDNSFDTEDVNTHQLVSYATKFAITAATTDREQFTSGEFTNLADLLQTTLRRCIKLGVVDQVKANLPIEIFNQLQLENK